MKHIDVTILFVIVILVFLLGTVGLAMKKVQLREMTAQRDSLVLVIHAKEVSEPRPKPLRSEAFKLTCYMEPEG